MAQVPNPLAAISAVSGGRPAAPLQVDAPAGAFGASTADALTRAGGQMRQDAADLNSTAIAMQTADNEVMANDARNRAVEAATKRLVEFKALEGQDAVAGFDQYQADIKKIFEDQTETLPNPHAQRLYSSVSGRYVANYLGDAVAHSATENKRWQEASSAATITTAVTAAVQFRSNPVQVAAQADLAAATAMQAAQRKGLDDTTTATRATAARSQVYAAVIGTLAADPKTVFAAQNMLEQARSKLDGITYEKLVEHLKPKVLDARANAEFLTITRQAPGGIPQGAELDQVWDTIKFAESRHSQFEADGVTPKTSSKGATGIAQVMPGTGREVAGRLGVAWDEGKFRNDPAYNEMLGKAYFVEMLNKYEGNYTLAAAAYNAGPARVDEWLKNPAIGDPRKGDVSAAEWASRIPFDETRNYVSRIATRLAAQSPDDTSRPRPPEASRDMVLEAIERTKGDPELQARTVSKVSAYVHAIESAGAQDRAAILHRVNDLTEQFLDGNPNNQGIPVAEIKARLPPGRAAEAINNLNAAMAAGEIFKGVALATPATKQQMRADLIGGEGVYGAMLKGKGSLLRSDTGDVAPGDTQDLADYRLRRRVADLLEQRITKQESALKADGATFVAQQDPQVRALLPGANSTPEDWQRYALATLTSQARLGVEPGRQAVLGVPEADALVRKFTQSPPDQFDARATLVGMSKQYGAVWPTVFGQLVRQGLPSEYRVLGFMDAPGQEGAAAQLQNALVTEYSTKGGRAALKAGMPHETQNDISSRIASQLAGFRETLAASNEGERAYHDITNAVEAMAYQAVFRGKTASEAVAAAVDGVITKHYDVRGTFRIPRFMDGNPISSDAVVTATNFLRTSLKPEDLAALQGAAGLTPDDRRINYAVSLADTQTARWVNNFDDRGLTLAVLTRSGNWIPALRADGSRVSFTFDNIPAPPANWLSMTSEDMNKMPWVSGPNQQ